MRALILGLTACAVLSAQPTSTQTATSIRGVPINRPNQNAAVPYFSTAVNRILWGTLAELGPVSGSSWSGTVDIASIAAGGKGCGTFTATGATTGTALAPLWPALDAGLVGGTIRVSASNTIEVCLINATASPIDPSPAAFGAAAQGGVSNSIAWGGITGTLSAQVDLQSALDGKAAVSHNHDATYVSLSGSYSNPTWLSSLAWSKLTSVPSTFAPSAHASSHQNGGGDEIATATPGANAIPKAGAGGTLASGWIPDLSSVYSLTSHNHSGVYAPASHTHAYTDILSAPWPTYSSGASAPSGGCTAPAIYAETTSNPDVMYHCVSGAWQQIGGAGGSATWGSITGTLSAQTDLQSALDAKAAASHNHAASEITSGTIATARLGSGTADSTTFLRGDNTWATPSGSLPSMTGKNLYTLKVNSSTPDAEWILDTPGAGMSKTRVGSTDVWAVDSTQVPYTALDNAFLGRNTFAGVVAIPGSATPTTDAVGELDFDTNAWATGRGALQLYDGTANTYLLGVLASDTPANGQVPKWNTGGTITWEDDSVGSGSFGETSLSTLANNQTLWDSTNASRTLTAGLSGANDPVITFSDNLINITTGALQVGGAAVVTTAAGNAPTATALAANPTDCSANQFANAIAANGNLTCAAIADADVPDTITASNYLPLTGGTITGDLTVNGSLTVGDGTVAGELQMNELTANGTNYRSWTVPDALTASLTMRFPDTLPSGGEVLTFGAPSGGISTMAFQAVASANTASAIVARDGSGNFSAGTITAALSGNATTASALAANGSNCSAGQFPLGVDASGASESCTALPTSISGTANEISASAATGSITLSIPSTLDLGGKAVEIPNGTSLPGTCTVGQIFFDTDATLGQQFYACTSTNTWTVQGDGTGSGFGETSLATLANNQTLWNSANASRTLTAGLSGANDPVITFSDNLINITTGALQVGGSAVVTTSSGNAPTATALAANASNCSGQVAIGVDASGACEGTATPTLGTAGSVVGSIAFANATSGTITVQPTTGALGTSVLTLPATTGTLLAPANGSAVGQVLRMTAVSPATYAFGAVDLADTDAVTGTLPASNLPAASDTAAGIQENATAAETTTGSATDRTVTPNSLRASDFGKRDIVIELFDDTTAVTTGDGKYYLPIPATIAGWNIVAVQLHTGSANSSSGTVNVDIARCAAVATGVRCSGTVADVLSTNLTIDANEDGSETAATAAVIDTANDDLPSAGHLRIDVDGAGTGTKGLQIIITVQKP